MRRFTLALAAATLALGITAASAADIGQRPVYKAQPAPMMAAYNWSGFYVGGHLGYAWGSEEVRRQPHRRHRQRPIRAGSSAARRSASTGRPARSCSVSKATGPGPTPTVRSRSRGARRPSTTGTAPPPPASVTRSTTGSGTSRAAPPGSMPITRSAACTVQRHQHRLDGRHRSRMGARLRTGPPRSNTIISTSATTRSAPYLRRSGHAGPSRQARPELPLRLGQSSGCRAVLIRTSYETKNPGPWPGVFVCADARTPQM